METQEQLSTLMDFRLERMKVPESISLDQIVVGDRARTNYYDIEGLAQSILDNGLIQPIVLVPLGKDSDKAVEEFQFLQDHGYEVKLLFGLDAGGRRYHALKHLEVKTLWHATTCDPARPGFILKGEEFATPLRRLYTEIAENLDRDELEWRDAMKLLNKAWRLSRTEADAKGERLLMRDFGAMIGVGYANLQAAVAIHDDVIANPERYKDVTGIRAAYSILLKVQEEELTKMRTAKSLAEKPFTEISTVTLEPKVSAQPEPEPGVVRINLSESFFHMDAIEWLRSMPNEAVDHIITDPDYAVSVERLEASLGDASAGVQHENVEASLDDLRKFVKVAARVIRPQGFLILWYDLDHHEKLQRMATESGFKVQRWPLIWHKNDYRSNAAPAHNFCKNVEYAMVCRKPNAVLAKAQMSSIYTCAAGDIARKIGHPFAKPFELWSWIYSAVCIKGQVVADPFMGRGSSSIAAMRWGLRPVGCEKVLEHYAGAISNIQDAYRLELGNRVTFQ